MLKIRIEGKKEEINEYLKIIQQDDKFTICNISDCYRNRGISIYERCYVEIEINDLEKEK